jgi:type IV pilus assembly protein PilY1
VSSCTRLADLLGSWTNVAANGSCDASAGSGFNCQYRAPNNSTTTSCTPVAASTGPLYTVTSAVTCTALANQLGPWTNTASCTTSASLNCQYSNPVNTTTTSCTPVAASAGPTYTVTPAVTCTQLANQTGPWTNAASCTAVANATGCQYTAWTGWAGVASCTAVPQSAGPNYTVANAVDCQTLVTAGSSDSLADVAMYYYNTDLRTSALNNCSSTVNGNTIDVCANNVSPAGTDTANWQHMTTFTLGLGVSGTLRYQSDYLTAASGDFHDIVQGTKNWPNPTQNGPTAVDDLWHAAVDGHGRYFSAGDPMSLANSLNTTLQSIDAKIGFGSAAAASNLQPVAGDNSLYLAKYKTVYWVGDLVAYSIDPTTGAISAPLWSAAANLQSAVAAGTARTIYYFGRGSGANTGSLRSFTYANLTTDGLNGLFDNACSKSPALTQCSTAGYATATANSGSNMVDFLRGGSNAVYRTHFPGDTDIGGGLLGDVIGGAPVYVGKPKFKYTENNYAGFAAAVNSTHSGAGRPGVVYMASNDGMLHAIDGSTGNEKWAYIPSMVMSKLYQLADYDYANRHQYYVNGAPISGDIFVPGSGGTPGAWKTILVGGLGAGGVGYYALDITDPDNPQALWEFANDSLGGNTNLGLTFGNPVITKRADGTWVVVFSSGYNNNTGGGDGNGHLFVVNANTGARVLDIPTYTSGTTPAGTVATPSGLNKINAWVDSDIDNSAKRFYGGDLLGNVWRFDIDNLVAPHQAALRLATLSAGGVAQPVTTEPTLAQVSYAGGNYPVVYVSTGKYLGTTDLGTTATQSIYAIKDPLTNTPLGDIHASSSFVATGPRSAAGASTC